MQTDSITTPTAAGLLSDEELDAQYFAALDAEGVEGTQGHMCESLMPCAGQFVGEAITKRPQYPGRVPMKHHGLSLWDGRPKYSSWYA